MSIKIIEKMDLKNEEKKVEIKDMEVMNEDKEER